MAETRRKRKAHSDASALPEFVEPMKVKLVESLPSGDWIYEIKFDGYRALALHGGSDTRILSRNEKDLGRKFTEVRDSVSALDVQDAIIGNLNIDEIELRTGPTRFWLVLLSARDGSRRQALYAVVLPDGSIVEPVVREWL
jgi:hypothetical protein